jgi:hypothetical protein
MSNPKSVVTVDDSNFKSRDLMKHASNYYAGGINTRVIM